MPPRGFCPRVFDQRRSIEAQCRYCLPRRGLSSVATAFQDHVAKPTSKYQIYTSRSQNPFLNLSIEHYLLQGSHEHSTVLFFYINRPSVVIGRNQNPWLEVDLKRLAHGHGQKSGRVDQATSVNSETSVDLVRRRSGGGAVFHDTGNVNYCVICPSRDFTRDKHAELIVEAIRQDNPRARVNERHDIVLDQGHFHAHPPQPNPSNMHETGYFTQQRPPLKVSGSAYKLTRTRSLHHGTCLLDSPNLATISQYLKSPARPFMKARGVDSVRSPVGNVYSDVQSDASFRFQSLVFEAFARKYGLDSDCSGAFLRRRTSSELLLGSNWVCGSLDGTVLEIPKIKAGMSELQSPNWIYGQTPQFTLSSFPVEKDQIARPNLPPFFPETVRVSMTVRSGIIDSAAITVSEIPKRAEHETKDFNELLKGLKVHEIKDFGLILRQVTSTDASAVRNVARWLNEMFATTT
ncbi:Biotin/lipoate A/B protein ligase [Lambiella insularis]|nr:Biotin/lipoate A/B protein ligase [Lambiella insularis]